MHCNFSLMERLHADLLSLPSVRLKLWWSGSLESRSKSAVSQFFQTHRVLLVFLEYLSREASSFRSTPRRAGELPTAP